jgi:hypothetical protein
MLLDFLPKSKEGWFVWLDRTLVPAIIALVAIMAFGLGRLSALSSEGSLIIHPPSQAAAAAYASVRDFADIAQPEPWLSAEEAPAKNPYAAGNPDGPHNFSASKTGTKYYPAGCAGANRIKETNKIWFATEDEAKLAGYSKATSCK